MIMAEIILTKQEVKFHHLVKEDLKFSLYFFVSAESLFSPIERLSLIKNGQLPMTSFPPCALVPLSGALRVLEDELPRCWWTDLKHRASGSNIRNMTVSKIAAEFLDNSRGVRKGQACSLLVWLQWVFCPQGHEQKKAGNKSLLSRSVCEIETEGLVYVTTQK